PFPLQGFHIKSVSDAQKVQNFCKFVFIDVEKGASPPDQLSHAPSDKPRKAQPQTFKASPQKIKLKSVKYTNHQPLEQELTRGEAIYHEIESAFEKSVRSLKKNEHFD